MIEVHNQPELALSDSAQALTLSEYAQLIEEVRTIRDATGPFPTTAGQKTSQVADSM
jgi:3-deoxy-D-arabino-heptulosonate 7-phosphate (DAHP) synthase